MQLYWADLHNHHEVGYGEGSLDRAAAIAASSLNIHALTPHGWWPDVPPNLPAVRDYHEKGFDKVRNQWERVVHLSNEMNGRARFVSLLGFEWHSIEWGDYCVLFPGAGGNLSRARSLDELKSFAREQNALLIPHHCAYALGSRGTFWPGVDSALSPVAEIFSEHGNSLEGTSFHGMYGHSMGSSEHAQTVLHQLQSGRICGFVAGTDNHYGHPGAYGEGLTGIYSDSLTRDSVLEALRKRHCYAVTGDRIRLRVGADSAMMGDILDAAHSRTIQLSTQGLAPLESVSVVKNGRVAAVWSPQLEDTTSNASEAANHYVGRIEWGWGGLYSTEVTEWSIRLRVTDGAIVEVIPCFVSGSKTVGHTNVAEFLRPDEVQITSASSRSNPRPVQGVILRLQGTPSSRCELHVAARVNETCYEREIAFSYQDRRWNDTHLSLYESFTSPQLKIHRFFSEPALSFTQEWHDDAPGCDDFYYVKVIQQNGQIAWSSPIWFSSQWENKT